VFIKKFLLGICASFFLAHSSLAMKREHEDEPCEPPVFQIPYDIFVKIFYDLNLAEWQRACLVCQKWYASINNDLFWCPLIRDKFGNLASYLSSKKRRTKEVYLNDRYAMEILNIENWPVDKIKELIEYQYYSSRKKLLDNLEHAVIKKSHDLEINEANKIASFILAFEAITHLEISQLFDGFSLLIMEKTCRYYGHAVRRRTCNVATCQKNSLREKINRLIAEIKKDDGSEETPLAVKCLSLSQLITCDCLFLKSKEEIRDDINKTMNIIVNNLFCHNPNEHLLFANAIAKISHLYSLSRLTEYILNSRFDQAYYYILNNFNLESAKDVIKITIHSHSNSLNKEPENPYYCFVKNILEYLENLVLFKNFADA